MFKVERDSVGDDIFATQISTLINYITVLRLLDMQFLIGGSTLIPDL